MEVFAIGDLVTISGLKSRPELNDTIGTVLYLRDESKRYAVKVAGESLRLKAANLQLEKEAADLADLASQLSTLTLETSRGNVLTDVNLVENIFELCMPDSRKSWGRHHFSTAELMDKPLKFACSSPGSQVFQLDRQRKHAVWRRDLRGKACTFLHDGDIEKLDGIEGSGHFSTETPRALIFVSLSDTGEVVIVPKNNVDFVEKNVSLQSAAIQEVKDAIPTLLASRGVCRLWRTAACRPLLAAKLMHDITITVSMYFDLYTVARSLKGGLQKVPGLGRLSAADERTFQWLATGFENGVNSFLTFDPGIDHIRSAAALMQYFSIKKVTGKALVLAPRAACTAWEQALAAAKLECFQATPEREMDDVMDIISSRSRLFQGFGVVLLSYESGLSHLLHETAWKHAIFDVVGLSAAEARDKINLSSDLKLKPEHTVAVESVSTVKVTLASESLPTNLDDLWSVMEASSLHERCSMARFKKRAATAISKFGRMGDDAIERWAVESFLVPQLHSALHTSFHMHRKASEPDDAET